MRGFAMPRLRTLRITLACLLIAIGVGFICLPDEWIETWLGFSPDNGNGLAEAAIAAVPLALGLLLAADVLVSRVRMFIGAPVSRFRTRNR
jgi:uncharacterized protein involved in cysteine biosynthesis